jgi:hypothetical protein
MTHSPNLAVMAGAVGRRRVRLGRRSIGAASRPALDTCHKRARLPSRRILAPAIIMVPAQPLTYLIHQHPTLLRRPLRDSHTATRHWPLT